MTNSYKKGLLQAVCVLAFTMPAGYQAWAATDLPTTSTMRTFQSQQMVAAIMNNDMAKVKAMLDAGVDPNQNNGSALETAADMGHIHIVELLLAKGANPDLDDGFALSMAADHGNVAIVKLLIQKNINPFLSGIELFLEQMQVVKKDDFYEGSKYSKPEYQEIVDLINQRRKELDPTYIPKTYDAAPMNNSEPAMKLDF